MAKCKALTG